MSMIITTSLLSLLACSSLEPLTTFHVGVNHPWNNYGTDFGTSGWGDLSIEENDSDIHAHFEDLSKSGVQVVRWFVLCDGRSSPEFDEEGLPIGLEESFYSDMDTLLNIASQNKIHLVPVLLDFYWLGAAETVDGVNLGGRSDIIRDPHKRDLLIERVITPILEHYGKHPNIYAWDIINEPEHAMDYQGASWLGGGIVAEDMIDFVTQVTAAVHSHTEHLATVGSADFESMQEYWVDSELDLLQFHYYKENLFDEENTVDDDRPIVVGEFSSVDHPVSDSITRIRAGGFDGAWVWSLNAQDEHSNLDLQDLITLE